MGRGIKFKPATFYLGIADHLARVVENQDHPQEQAEGGPVEGADHAEHEDIRQEGERVEMAESLSKGDHRVRDSTTQDTLASGSNNKSP